MGRSVNRLSARAVSTLAKHGMHPDGDNLYLQISNNDSKSWIFRFTLNGKPRAMGLGSVSTISLAEAREEATQCRKMVRDGIDPIEARKAMLAGRRENVAKLMTFKQCAEAYISAHRAGWKNVKHAAQWSSSLNMYAYPVFGDLPVQAVDVGLVMKALEPIWATKTETAGRIRGRIENILDWAKTRKFRDGENPARWKGHLDKLLPAKSKVKKVKHHKALPYGEIGGFIAKLRQQNGISAISLEFLILTAARTSEVIEATWDEIDLANKVWTIPPDRMKAGNEHRVPLTPRAVEILEKAAKLKTSKYVFPGNKRNRPLSNMALLKLLKRMEVKVTVHGFRSTFKDWSLDMTSYPREVSEMALAHTISNQVEAAYMRTDLFTKRFGLMKVWADYCNQPDQSDGDNVVNLVGG